MAATGLADLPVELLYTIQLFALSPSFPLVSSHVYNSLRNTSPRYKAQYLIRTVIGDFDKQRWDHPGEHPLEHLSTMLKYPLCTQPVLDAVIEDIESDTAAWEQRIALQGLTASELSGRTRWKRYNPVIELPRRLFRNMTPLPSPPSSSSTSSQKQNTHWKDRSHPLPFLRHLFAKTTSLIPQEELRIDSNSHDGYALIRAVHCQFAPLVQFLLDHGASPLMKDGLAVIVAIRNKDLPMTKLLIERSEQLQTTSKAPSPTYNGTTLGRGKKRKLEDRVSVTPEMLKAAIQCDARAIVEYLMDEKGCVPDLPMLSLVNKASVKKPRLR